MISNEHSEGWARGLKWPCQGHTGKVPALAPEIVWLPSCALPPSLAFGFFCFVEVLLKLLTVSYT